MTVPYENATSGAICAQIVPKCSGVVQPTEQKQLEISTL
jgi:hypothetical protein